MTRLIEVIEALKPEQCCVCGVWFAMPNNLVKQRRRDGELFYCPVGHEQYFTDAEDKQKEIEHLKNALANQVAWTDQVEAEREAVARKLSATRGVVTRIKNRVKNGVCPCCNRHFENLQRHMGTKHPNWQPDGEK